MKKYYLLPKLIILSMILTPLTQVNAASSAIEMPTINLTGSDTINLTGNAINVNDLYIKNTGDNGSGDYNFDTGTLFIDSSAHRIGIGTTSPSALLTVGANNQFTIDASGNVDIISGGSLQVGGVNVLTTELQTLSATEIDQLETIDSTTITNAQWGYLGALGSQPIEAANPTFTGDATFNTNTLFVDSTTNEVGIGTTTPQYALDVFESTSDVMRLKSNNYNAWLYLEGDSSNSKYTAIGSSGDNLVLKGQNYSSLNIGYQNVYPPINDVVDLGTSGNRWQDFYSIDGFFSGNVGIGTTDPGAKLEVSAGSSNATIVETNSASPALAGTTYQITDTGAGAPPFIQWKDTDDDTIAGINGGGGSMNFYHFTENTARDLNTNTDTPTLTLKTGNVGIGTTEPGADLDIGNTNTGTDTQIRLQGATDGNQNMLVLSNGYGGTSTEATLQVNNGANIGAELYYTRTGSSITLQNRQAGTIYFNSSTTHGVNNGNIMTLLSGGNVGIGTTSPSALLTVGDNDQFRVSSDGTINGALDTTEINFLSTVTGNVQSQIDSKASSTSPIFTGDATFNTNTLFVDSTNNRVGIGTTGPETGLHLFDGTNVGVPQNSGREATLTIEAGSEGSADLQFLSSQGYNHIFFGDAVDPNVGTILYDHTTDSMQFAVQGTEKFRISGSGNVGIGTTTPQSSLQVSGYTQLDTVTSAPPSADCDAATEEGRMKFDATNDLLYICSGVSGWVSK